MLYLLVVQVFGSAADKWYLLTPLGWGKLIVLFVIYVAWFLESQYGLCNNDCISFFFTPVGLPVLVVAITAAIRPEQYGHYSNKMS